MYCVCTCLGFHSSAVAAPTIWNMLFWLAVCSILLHTSFYAISFRSIYVKLTFKKLCLFPAVLCVTADERI